MYRGGSYFHLCLIFFFLAPPHIQSFGEYSPLENSNLHIRCNISGNPSPNWDQVHWTKIESISFRVSGFSLYFNEISRQEAGIYTCHVTTLLELTSGQILTKTDNKNVTIDVLCKFIIIYCETFTVLFDNKNFEDIIFILTRISFILYGRRSYRLQKTDQ